MSIYPSDQSFNGAQPPEYAVLKKVHILVMGLMGAGKSTFIKAATGDPNIKIGHDLDAGTVVVAEYVRIHGDYEIHLIDTPGFGDASQSDAEILDGIATMMNTVYRLSENIAGVLYLHDITRNRVDASGENTLRLLEKMLGELNFGSCTLVTTMWDKYTSPEATKEHERFQGLLETQTRLWKRLTGKGARVARFHNSHESAMKIIVPILDESFVPDITQEMVSAGGSALVSLRDTRAGAHVLDYGKKRLKADGQIARIEQMQHVLDSGWREDVFQKFLKERRRLEQLRVAMKGALIVLRLGFIGGGLVATVVTKNPTMLLKTIAMSTAANSKLKSTGNRKLDTRERILRERLGALLDSPIVDLSDTETVLR